MTDKIKLKFHSNYFKDLNPPSSLLLFIPYKGSKEVNRSTL